MVLKLPNKARVVQDYQAFDPDPPEFTTGEVVQVGEKDTRWPAFVRCRNRAGKAGWVPEIFIERDEDTGVVNVDYSAVELTVRIGDALTLEREVGGWFWAIDRDGRRGWVPAECIETP